MEHYQRLRFYPLKRLFIFFLAHKLFKKVVGDLNTWLQTLVPYSWLYNAVFSKSIKSTCETTATKFLLVIQKRKRERDQPTVTLIVRKLWPICILFRDHDQSTAFLNFLQTTFLQCHSQYLQYFNRNTGTNLTKNGNIILNFRAL